MRRVAIGLLCALCLAGCSPALSAISLMSQTELTRIVYIGFRATPSWLDELYSDQWPGLVEALKLRYPDQYWAALQSAIDAVHAGRLTSNPLMAEFGYQAAFASDEVHRRVAEAYIAYLRHGMQGDADFCLRDDLPDSALGEVHDALVDAVTDGVLAPTRRPDATRAGQQVVVMYVLKRGVEPSKFDSMIVGDLYPGACADFIVFLEALNHLDVVDAKVWRANIIAYWTGLL